MKKTKGLGLRGLGFTWFRVYGRSLLRVQGFGSSGDNLEHCAVAARDEDRVNASCTYFRT